MIYGNSNWATTAQGVTPDYMTIRDYLMMSGQFFTTQDVDAAAKSAVLGETVAGVLTPKGQSPSSHDLDDVIRLPLSMAKQKVFGANKANAKAVSALMVQAPGPQFMEQALQEMTALLRERHRILSGQDHDFTVRNLIEVFAAQETSAQVSSSWAASGS